MKLHTKQFQIGMNSAVAAQLFTPQNACKSPLMVISKEKIFKVLLY